MWIKERFKFHTHTKKGVLRNLTDNNKEVLRRKEKKAKI